MSATASLLEGASQGDAVRIHGFGGVLEGTRVLQGVEVGFQGLRTGSRDLRVIDLSMRSRMGGVEVSGFLGLDILGEARIEIDTVARRIRVLR